MYLITISYKKKLLLYEKFLNYIKKFLLRTIIYKKKISLNITMGNQGLNLSLNELKLIAEHRNISDYENKSAKDLIKALRGSKPRLGIKNDKLKEVKEDFFNLRHKFSKKHADKYRKLFCNIKNYRTFYELEIEKTRKRFNKLEKSLNFENRRNYINTINYEVLNSDKELNVEVADDNEYRK